jgi:alkylation response protein AidB-like acyl-CoA dehydrogenase
MVRGAPQPTERRENMKLTEEQLLIQKTARDFATNEVLPRIDEILENEGYIPRDIYKRMGELGFFGILVDKKDGGLGLGVTEFCLVAEELSKVAPTLGLILMCVVPRTAQLVPNEHLKEKYLAGILAGDLVIHGAATPPQGQTNNSEFQVFAKKTDGGYLLNGTRLFATNAAACDVHQAYGLDEDHHMRIFTIPGDAEGFNHDAPEIKFGMKGSGGGTCTYKNVFCPDDMVIDGEVGGGDYFYKIWLCAAAITLGAMEGALAQAIDYATTRTYNFKPVASIQAQAQRIAKLKCQEAACHALVYDAAADYEDEATLQDAYLKSMLAKAFVPTLAFNVTRECMKLHGGLGYSDVHIYHYFTDAVAGSIMDQTTEILLEKIAHAINLPDELY